MRTRPYAGSTPPHLPVAAAAAAEAAAPAVTEHAPELPLSPHATFHRLRMAGFTPREAGSLVAHLVGLRTVTSGWAIEEVERLLFVRALVDTDRMGS